MAVRNIHFVCFVGAFLEYISVATEYKHGPYCDLHHVPTGVEAYCVYQNSATFREDILTLPPNVTELVLAGSLGSITEGMFAVLPFARGLTGIRFMWDSKIDSVQAGSFKGLTNLTALTFISTALTLIPTGLVDGVTKLKQLHFTDHEKVTSVENGVFSAGACVESIDFSRNAIETISDETFKNASNCLTLLSLDKNILTTLPNDVFNVLVLLKKLLLTNNTISLIEDNAFAGLGNLKTLRLDYNSLTTLAVACLKPVGAAAEVFLQDNPWNCTCDLDPLRTWIQENHNFTADVRCETPANLKEKSLVTLTHEEVCGDGPAEYVDAGLYIGITFLVLFLILIAAGGFIYLYQKRKGTSSKERLT